MFTEKRALRYASKLEHIKKRVSSILQWLNEVKGKPTGEADEKTILAIFKGYQEIVDSLMDIMAMMCKDSGIPPEDDAYNIKRLSEKMIITIKDSDVLNKAEEIRNKIIRDFVEINYNDVLSDIEEIIEDVPDILKVIEAWLEKQKQSMK